MPFVFPDDFKTGNTARISLFPGKLSEYNLAGIVLLGSPAGTHSALAYLQDTETVHFPVVSFFSQDDELGTEALSDLVIDYAFVEASVEDIAANPDIALDISAQKFDELLPFIPELLGHTVYYLSLLNSPLPKNADLRIHAAQMAGKGWKILPYIDAETGLHPINRFIIAKDNYE
jgi:hypothetical protein